MSAAGHSYAAQTSNSRGGGRHALLLGCGCFGEDEWEPPPRGRFTGPPRRTLELARALAGRVDEARFMHRRSGRYTLVRRFPQREPDGPWAPYLADRSLWYWSVALDLDTKRDTGDRLSDALVRAIRKADRRGVRRDLDTIVQLCRAAGLWFLAERSPASGGVHVWLPSDRGLHPALVADTAVRLAVRCPTLDVSPLVNPVTGTLRIPGAPHLLGGRSHILQEYLDVESMDTVARVEQAGDPAAVLAVRAYRMTADMNVIEGRLRAHHWAVLQPLYEWAERLGTVELYRPYEGIAKEAGRSSGWSYETLHRLLGSYVEIVTPGLQDRATATTWRVIPPPGLRKVEMKSLDPSRSTDSNLPKARIRGDGGGWGEAGRRERNGEPPGLGGMGTEWAWMFSQRKRKDRGERPYGGQAHRGGGGPLSSSEYGWASKARPGQSGALPQRLDHRSPAFRDGSGTLRVALALLSGGSLTQEEVERFGIPRSTVSWALRRLSDLGLAVRSGRRYSLSVAAYASSGIG